LDTWHVNHALDVFDGGGHARQLVLRRWDSASLVEAARLRFSTPQST
jgi:hypothetical protein